MMQIIPITIDRLHMARALAAYEARPDLIDQVAAKFAHLDRVDAELKARRMCMSGSLCVQIGLSPETDYMLMQTDPWVTVIDTLLRLYDNTKAQEAS